MRAQLKMTIQDYFRQSGIHPSPMGGGPKESTLAGNDESFSRTLAAAQASALSDSGARCLTIRDYAARPMPVRAPSPLQANTLKEAPMPGGARQLPNSDLENITKSVPLNSLTKPSAAPELEIRNEKSEISASIRKAARRYDLPTSLIRAVVQAESSYQVQAVSPAGAQGLMQLMPATAKELGVKDPFDIDQNIDGGARYLRNMLDRFDGDIRLALSAYNAGPGTVAKYNGNVPYPETRQYVERVLRYTQEM